METPVWSISPFSCLSPTRHWGRANLAVRFVFCRYRLNLYLHHWFRLVVISRAAISPEFPCSFLRAYARNPSPCGYQGDPGRRCRCAPFAVQKYRSRISGPLLDRIDLHVDVPVVPCEKLVRARDGRHPEPFSFSPVSGKANRCFGGILAPIFLLFFFPP